MEEQRLKQGRKMSDGGQGRDEATGNASCREDPTTKRRLEAKVEEKDGS